MTDHPGLIPRQQSVLLTLELMGQAVVEPMSPTAKRLALQYVIERRPCPLCGAERAQWCRTFGWTSTVMRTHVARLQLTKAQLQRAACWAMEEEDRLLHRAQGDDEDL